MNNANQTQTRRDQLNQTFCGFVPVLDANLVVRERDAKIMVSNPDMDIADLRGLTCTFTNFTDVDWASVCLFDFTGKGREAKIWKVIQKSLDSENMTEVARGSFTSCILLIGLCRNNYARAFGNTEIAHLLGGAFGKVRSCTSGVCSSSFISFDVREEIERMLSRAITIASWISRERKYQVERSSLEIRQSMPAVQTLSIPALSVV